MQLYNAVTVNKHISVSVLWLLLYVSVPTYRIPLQTHAMSYLTLVNDTDCGV